MAMALKDSVNIGQSFNSAAHLYHFAADITIAFCIIVVLKTDMGDDCE